MNSTLTVCAMAPEQEETICAQKCFKYLYDLMTVLISIADVTTDIIVLLAFYQQDRHVFFIISLCILIVSHIADSILFLFRFDVIVDHGWCICVRASV